MVLDFKVMKIICREINNLFFVVCGNMLQNIRKKLTTSKKSDYLCVTDILV